MSDSISREENNVNELIALIMRQTDYEFNTAKEKLLEYNYDHLRVIKNYFGITEKKDTFVKSTNQEIYRQIRSKLDETMREYNERKEKETNANKL